MTDKHEEKKFKLTKVLALHGPASKWDLASEVGGRKKKGLTPFSWTVVYKLINELAKKHLVKKVGKARGEKHESELFALTSNALASLWWVKDGEIPNNWERIKENYAKIIDASEFEWMDFSYRTYQDPLLRPILHDYFDNAHPVQLDHDEILSEVMFNIPDKIKNRATRIKIARKIAKIASEYPHVKKEIREYLSPVLDEITVVRELLRDLEEP